MAIKRGNVHFLTMYFIKCARRRSRKSSNSSVMKIIDIAFRFQPEKSAKLNFFQLVPEKPAKLFQSCTGKIFKKRSLFCGKQIGEI